MFPFLYREQVTKGDRAMIREIRACFYTIMGLAVGMSLAALLS